jgi:hypothetical protein
MRQFLLFLMISVLAALASAQQSAFPRTASYGLFEIEGSGVHGNLQLTEDFEAGGLEAAVTLVGIMPGQQFVPAIFRGTCGPDRPFITALPPVGSFTNDPFVSLGEVELGYDEMTEGEFFMFIFPGDSLPPLNEAGNVETDSAVACGQIGAGANR